MLLKTPRQDFAGNFKPLESLKFEQAEGTAIPDDISSQSIVVHEGASVCLVSATI
jgi:hypothetical protein